MTNRIEEDQLSANEKRIRVNAQVTFMISLVEMIGSFLTMMVVVIFKTTTFPVIISIMITYLILLPCAFLMNTSHNKLRVIEHGWRNVLRNTLGLSPMPYNPDCNQRGKGNKTKSSSRLNKEKQNAVYPYNRGQVNSQTISHDLGRSMPTGSTSTLVVADAEKTFDCKGQKQKKPLEMMNPEKLEQAYQMHRQKISLISFGDTSVFDCKANQVTKRSGLKSGKILIFDLEQESELLFGCK